MILDLSLIETPQIQNASPSIGCPKELFNYHWLLLKTCAENLDSLIGFLKPFSRCLQTNCISRCGYFIV
jgi:hypothetical protein